MASAAARTQCEEALRYLLRGKIVRSNPTTYVARWSTSVLRSGDVVGSVDRSDVPSKPDACSESLREFTGHVYKGGDLDRLTNAASRATTRSLIRRFGAERGLLL